MGPVLPSSPRRRLYELNCAAGIIIPSRVYSPRDFTHIPSLFLEPPLMIGHRSKFARVPVDHSERGKRIRERIWGNDVPYLRRHGDRIRMNNDRRRSLQPFRCHDSRPDGIDMSKRVERKLSAAPWPLQRQLLYQKGISHSFPSCFLLSTIQTL